MENREEGRNNLNVFFFKEQQKLNKSDRQVNKNNFFLNQQHFFFIRRF